MIRFLFITLVLCPISYVGLLLGFAKLACPNAAEGSLLRDAQGKIIGSRLIAQAFDSEKYFHPRPSACSYRADASSGSNLSPKSVEFTKNAAAAVEKYQANEQRLLPADLASMSGSGLDPDISLQAAIFQAPQIAKARNLSEQSLRDLVAKHQRALLSGELLVNVLELNIALDQLHGRDD